MIAGYGDDQILGQAVKIPTSTVAFSGPNGMGIPYCPSGESDPMSFGGCSVRIITVCHAYI